MFLSNLNILDGVIHSISQVGVFVQHPLFLALTAFAVLFTAVLSRYEAHQKAERLVRETRKRHAQAAREMRQQHELLHHMIQNKSDKI
jgi:hypothetical protein